MRLKRCVGGLPSGRLLKWYLIVFKAEPAAQAHSQIRKAQSQPLHRSRRISSNTIRTTLAFPPLAIDRCLMATAPTSFWRESPFVAYFTSQALSCRVQSPASASLQPTVPKLWTTPRRSPTRQLVIP